MIILKHDLPREFRILNLTDPQLTNGEWEDGNRVGRIFKKTVEELTERVKPDLITLSGDLSYADQFESYIKFADYFDGFGIPWTCCFGNHDNQDGDAPVRRVLDEYKKHDLFLFEECDPALGNGNFVILVEIGSRPAEGVILMDTHDRIPYRENICGINQAWAGLTTAQQEWYAQRVAELADAGCHDSTLIIHIPIYAYFEAAKAAFKNPVHDKSVAVEDSGDPALWNPGYEGSFGVWHEPISAYPEEEGALDLIAALGSTKNIISGHDHVNNWVVKYRGVRLIFGTKTGIGSYFEPEINGGTVLTVDADGVSSVRHEYVDIKDLL